MLYDVKDEARRAFMEAVLDVLRAVGPERATLEAVGARLGRSRTSMYREYGTLPVLLEEAHDAAVSWISRGLGLIHVGEPRAQVEDVFAELRAFARTPRGQAFRALRSRVAALGDLEDFRRREAEGLAAVRHWLHTLVDRPRSRPDLVTELTATLWSLALGRGARDPGPPSEAELDLAWQLLSPHLEPELVPADPEPDLDATCLGPLLS